MRVLSFRFWGLLDIDGNVVLPRCAGSAAPVGDVAPENLPEVRDNVGMRRVQICGLGGVVLKVVKLDWGEVLWDGEALWAGLSVASGAGAEEQLPPALANGESSG